MVTRMTAPIIAPRALSLALCCALALSACSEKKSAAKDRDEEEKATPSLTMDEKFGLFMKENSELADAVEKENNAAGAVKVWDGRKAPRARALAHPSVRPIIR